MHFNKFKLNLITQVEFKMHKQKVELNNEKKKVPDIFRKKSRKFSRNCQNFQRNFAGLLHYSSRVTVVSREVCCATVFERNDADATSRNPIATIQTDQ